MRILIIDNDKSTVTTLKALILSQEKIEIDVALSGEEGLDKMKNFPNYDLAMIDIMMPKLSGMDVCKAMVNDWQLSLIPVLLMSSALPLPPEEYEESLRKFSDLRVIKAVIEKPFSVDVLLEKMHKIARKPL
ncbi:MAG: response regulator [Patescibacteria group bacterium]|jgi:DNA-binding response OmpR family regulator|nr:response regulator [Patescibacteria group bacterium]